MTLALNNTVVLPFHSLLLLSLSLVIGPTGITYYEFVCEHTAKLMVSVHKFSFFFFFYSFSIGLLCFAVFIFYPVVVYIMKRFVLSDFSTGNAYLINVSVCGASV